MNPAKRLLPPGIILFVIFCVGTAGYVLIERWTFREAVYMVVITLSTVGFRELHALSAAGEILTMTLIVTGVGTALYAGGKAVELIVEGNWQATRREREWRKKSEN